jgi:hypothetical protein
MASPAPAKKRTVVSVSGEEYLRLQKMIFGRWVSQKIAKRDDIKVYNSTNSSHVP